MRNRGSASHSRPSSLSWHPVLLPPCGVIYLPWGRLDQSVLPTPWDRASATSAHPWGPGSGHQSRLAEPGESLAEQTVPTPGEVAVSSEFPGEACRLCIWADLESIPGPLTLWLCALGQVNLTEPHFPHLQNRENNSTRAATYPRAVCSLRKTLGQGR